MGHCDGSLCDDHSVLWDGEKVVKLHVLLWYLS